MRRRSELPELELTSQDPLQFCLKVKQELGHHIDPDLVTLTDLSLLRKWLFINQGWRLTYRGANLLIKHYRSYTSQNPSNEVMTGKVLLNMDASVGGPWWSSGARIVVFSQLAHFELEMVDGNARSFVDFRNSR